MGISTFSYTLREFISVIIKKFLPEKIIFPSTELEINKITSGFKKLERIPNIIGAIDGSHIPIKAPHLFPVDYFNRKGFYSIVLQVVVDHKKNFWIYVLVGQVIYMIWWLSPITETNIR